jgi:DNA uptake protein ComE-like DNA-binding protein
LTDLEGWKKLGFSEKQAQVIVNYRDRNLKGSFKNLEDIQKCFVISAEKFEEIKPYIILNQETIKLTSPNDQKKSGNLPEKSEESKTDFAKIDLNEITFKQLIEYGFDEKSASGFIGFRNKLGGFVNKEQILDIYNIDKIQAQRLIYVAPLTTDKVQKYSLMDAPESWLKNHPYFKYYADKIIYYRISFDNEKKFFKTMKIKPEAEEKMKLYLKK